MGAGPTSVESLLKAQQALINEQMKEIAFLKEHLAITQEERNNAITRAVSAEKALKREEEKFLRSLQSLLGMLPTLKGHEMGEFIAACCRADASEFQIRDALKLYDAAGDIQIDTLAKQMATVLREKR